jgi:cell division GTPase FtsZ
MAHVMVIGLGGTGGKVLRRLHEHLSELPPDQRRRFRLLAIDTDQNALQSLPIPEDAKIHARVNVRGAAAQRRPASVAGAVPAEAAACRRARPWGRAAAAAGGPGLRLEFPDDPGEGS